MNGERNKEKKLSWKTTASYNNSSLHSISFQLKFARQLDCLLNGSKRSLTSLRNFQAKPKIGQRKSDACVRACSKREAVNFTPAEQANKKAIKEKCAHLSIWPALLSSLCGCVAGGESYPGYINWINMTPVKVIFYPRLSVVLLPRHEHALIYYMYVHLRRAAVVGLGWSACPAFTPCYPHFHLSHRFSFMIYCHRYVYFFYITARRALCSIVSLCKSAWKKWHLGCSIGRLQNFTLH